jgi:hypothetical protein
MSLTKNPDRKPHVKTTAGSNWCGFSLRSTASAFHSKKPTRCRVPTISIIENTSTMVEKSIKCSASPGRTTRNATIPTAPMSAAPVRSIFNPGNFPRANTTELARKMTYAARMRASESAAGESADIGPAQDNKPHKKPLSLAKNIPGPGRNLPSSPHH